MASGEGVNGELVERERLQQKHRRETKELRGMHLLDGLNGDSMFWIDTAKVQALKKGIPKGDKKRKKEVMVCLVSG